jgi:hypothetical protein
VIPDDSVTQNLEGRGWMIDYNSTHTHIHTLKNKSGIYNEEGEENYRLCGFSVVVTCNFFKTRVPSFPASCFSAFTFLLRKRNCPLKSYFSQACTTEA